MSSDTTALLSLLVLRSRDIKRLVAFYQQLGLSFTLHRHGSGPEHYACENEQVVFEIYPYNEGSQDTTATRIGFTVNNIETAMAALTAAGGTVVSKPKQSPWGQRAVIDDPDGHRVELLERTK